MDDHYYYDNYLINHFRKINVIRKKIDSYNTELLPQYDFRLMFNWRNIQLKINDVDQTRYLLKNWGINRLEYSLDWINNREKYLKKMKFYEWIEKIKFDISTKRIKSARIR